MGIKKGQMSLPLRLLIIEILHLVLKGFDPSYDGFWDISPRAIAYALFMGGYWLAVWYSIDKINRREPPLHMAIIILSNIVIASITAFLCNYFIRLGDIHIFGSYEVWENISIFNPAFTIALFFCYMLSVSIDLNILANAKVQNEALRIQMLEKANLQSQVDALKSQVEPHFLFNSLSVLTSIIHKDQDLATKFAVKLSKTMRHILEKDELTLISLNDELETINDYFFLLRMRFHDAIKLEQQFDPNREENTYVPPGIIQGLIENALKHNKATTSTPLCISISVTGDYLVVSNNINKRKNKDSSVTLGLDNARKRYAYIAGKDINVKQTDNEFSVKLPLLTQADYESANN